MWFTNLKLIFRNLWRNKITSSINILGFAFSLSICFVIGIYIRYEFSYDKFHKNYEHLFRVVNAEKQRAEVDYTIKEEILKEIPEVSGYCHILMRNFKIPIQYENKSIDLNNWASADNHFFDLFSFPLVMGNQKEPFDKSNRSLLVSEHVAKLLFEKENPLGKRVKVFNNDEYIICGVYKDFPKNSSMYADLIRNETYEVDKHSETSCDDKGNCVNQRTVFLTMSDPSQINQVIQKINARLKTKNKQLRDVSLQPLGDMYLFDHTKDFGFNKGNYKLIKLFLGIAFITLLLACLNYINLSIAQYNQRTRATGVRKVLGSGRLNLIHSFLTESVVVTLISMTLAVALTIVFLPLFNSLFNLQLQITTFIEGRYALLFIVFILTFGILNGIWPALLITSFNPVQIFQKRFVRIQGKDYIRNVSTTIQFTASITLIICVLLIVKQLNFMKHKDLGFRDGGLLKLTTYHAQKLEPLKNKLLQNPSILNATYSSGIPGEINWSFQPGLDAKEYEKGIPVIGGDASFIQTFQINVSQGCDFFGEKNEKVCLISETASKDLGWEKDWSNKYFQRGEDDMGYKVVGVFKDFHFRPMYQKIQPLVIEYNDVQKSFLTLRLSGQNISETMSYITKTWNEIESGVPIDFAFYDTWFDSMYKKEEQLAMMVSTFAVLAIIISCLGIFSQAILNTLNRIKEIGIRKINGAKVSEVMILLNKDLIKWVAIAFVIAAPIAWYTMNRWLGDFAYKTQVSWWIFVLAGGAVAILALIAVSWQSWKAANINPAVCLRDE